MKFTGHERDLLGTLSGTADDLDYMHARHESPLLGRFLSIDPAGGRRENGQSWNRYSYTLNNPLRYLDPDGREPLPANCVQFFNALFDTDLSFVDIQRDNWAARWRTSIAGGNTITLGHTIYMDPSATLSSWEEGTPAGLAFLGHELVHVLQQRQAPPRAFASEYLGALLGGLVRGQSAKDSYLSIVHERVGEEVQVAIREFLKANKDLADKLQQGEMMSEGDLKRVRDALTAAAAAGKLQTGFRIVEGFLVYVSIPR